jgi:DUF4097 and DUF4098 domain-containing protein YvlB
MKKYVWILLVIITMISSLQAEAQTANEFTVPLSDPAKRGKLKAHLNSGTIIVKGTARKDVLIKYSMMTEEENDHEDNHDDDNDDGHRHDNRNRNADKNKDGSREDSRAGLKRIGGGTIDLEVTENENFVKAESDSWNQPMKLEIEVPSGFDLQLHTYNDGDLMVTNIQGTLELNNFNGEITALNISGSVMANTFNGEIKVTFDKVTDGIPMSYSTYNGDIDITFPATLKSTVKLKTEQGSIYSSFDVELKNSGPVQKTEKKGDVYKVIVDDWKRGEINGGGSEITMRNYNGDIILRKK